MIYDDNRSAGLDIVYFALDCARNAWMRQECTVSSVQLGVLGRGQEIFVENREGNWMECLLPSCAVFRSGRRYMYKYVLSAQEMSKSAD